MRQPFFTLLMSGFRCRIGTFRCVYGVTFFVFIADRRNGLYDLDLAVAAHARTSRDEFTDDDVFFEAQERVDLAFDSRIGQDTGRFLEGCSRQEGVRCQCGLGDTEEHRFADSGLAAIAFDALVHIFKDVDVDIIARQYIGIAGVFDLHLAQHLADDDFDVLIVDTNTLGFVYLLYFVYEVPLGSFDTQYVQDVVGVDGAGRDAAALFDEVAFMYDEVGTERDGGAPFFTVLGSDMDDVDIVMVFFFGNRYGTADFRDDSIALRLTGFKQFFDTRKTLGDIAGRCDTARMEGTHGQGVAWSAVCRVRRWTEQRWCRPIRRH